MGSANQDVSAYGGSYTAHPNLVVGEENHSVQEDNEERDSSNGGNVAAGVDYINNEVAQVNNAVAVGDDQQSIRLRMPQRLSRIQRQVTARPRPQ